MKALQHFQHPGQYVRECRIQHGHTLRECAKVIGISPAHLSDVERGNRSITIPVAFALSRCLRQMMPARQLLVWQLDHVITRMKADLADSVDGYLANGGFRR